MTLLVIMVATYGVFIATAGLLGGPIFALYPAGYLAVTTAVGVLAGLGLLRTRFERSASWAIMTAIVVLLALGLGANGSDALRGGVVVGTVSLLFWEPGWRLGDWIRHRRGEGRDQRREARRRANPRSRHA